MEDRVQQFHLDAQRPRDAKTPKEIERLRKFLYKNQEYRFTEREQSQLFSAIQAHYAAHADLPDESAKEPALQLIDDALKMPFTVFTTSQKKTFLKWHAKLTGEGDGKLSSAAAVVAPDRAEYQVIDLIGDTVTCMTDEGDDFTVDLKGSDAGMVAQLRSQFEGGAAVTVTLDLGRRTLLAARTEET
ncbi:hypothetical protein VOLCADRAFT_92526 [Volvox carteri f. nagariensis]|uniref:Translation initiation factor 5A C-terminal domain-containing protein n=1 Tax=Volvox carteri f. nagariensis TaxID=3068 RepID=D8TZW4_VOLCA|nr:uncharacterized protein VOLCADRAFT_92526 [Volvox carteri f. nagariensis]EFJ46997.1 hypothetical protein VOLCADRAFT_92526 [Volvox carteri f. nagariensis]|eukprot:XP_002951892.1 hypothetical protein VOLCADRAFT_92526 [Volvox carteri f. nagariensis]